MTAKSPATSWVTGIVVFVLAFLRQPAGLVFEEPTEFWAMVPTMGPLEYLLTPPGHGGGYIQILGRAAFLVAHAFGEPVVTRLIAAGIIAAVAVYLTTLRDPIPRGRYAFALALPLLPIPYPGPYVGPLNGQWFVALAVVGIALTAPRRWHYPALFLGGLVGLAPCLAWPVFRDRRLVALLIPTVIQAAVLLSSGRPASSVPIDPRYFVVMLALAVAMAVARLPLRTRLAFLYLGLAGLLAGAVLTGWFENQYRYLAIPGAVVVLGLASSLLRHDVAPHEQRVAVAVPWREGFGGDEVVGQEARGRRDRGWRDHMRRLSRRRVAGRVEGEAGQVVV